jgi:hypothetical protein
MTGAAPELVSGFSPAAAERQTLDVALGRAIRNERGNVTGDWLTGTELREGTA